ncbi:MAG: tRNA pseudouridine(13) synthase TruD [Nitrospinaceae bacterium]|jgi:tRNA pseudouridine13 synthase|nr:tRNA pseudouridine(13) synthase TruD [Nitrospinaceae bacterium]MBT3432423.1 tRNA pseudouridine(13) synthase TruD [Nitrospinaceae bacterium]MBT4092965.1 tRNA pseudouridine(13) synthase TruD [Nitrospinaceae bacterium]MBT4429687.1 tRNA pseudouridine(13) synthase TruD [Nitrospinaceae bacterium]MBT5369188.1 tRNA pseudouridine(13) synthase TruD [Nitrospinaceae bacterium]
MSAVEGRFLTEAVPGTGGVIRTEPEDFRVEEISLNQPEGVGEHLYLRVEKRGVSTLEVLRKLCGLLGVDEKSAGYAGMKDARAVTRQWISILSPAPSTERKLRNLGNELPTGVTVLEIKRGRSKLRRGDLRGNRFDIRIRRPRSGVEDSARETLKILSLRGVPNAFGPQRFGARKNSAEVGRALALGDWGRAVECLLGRCLEGGGEEADREGQSRADEAAERFRDGDLIGSRRLYPESWRAEQRVLAAMIDGASPEKAMRTITRRERALFASAFQAAVFNVCLAQRMAGDTHAEILAGDVVVNHRSEKIRRVGDPAKERAARVAFEISPTGPLIGEKMLEARGVPGEVEARVFQELGVAPDSVSGGLVRMGARGGRRSYRARLNVLNVVEEAGDLRLQFELPPGAYATEVLREVMKVEPPAGARLYLSDLGG